MSKSTPDPLQSLPETTSTDFPTDMACAIADVVVFYGVAWPGKNQDPIESMAESGDLTQSLIPQTNSILNDLTTKMTDVLTWAQTSPQPLLANSSTAPINIKLEWSNYALWSQVVEMYISGNDKLRYINGDSPQPPETDPSLRRWRTENAIVKGWLINSMDPSLIANFIHFLTAKQVWDSAATTYFDGTDSSQVYDLRRRVTRMK